MIQIYLVNNKKFIQTILKKLKFDYLNNFLFV